MAASNEREDGNTAKIRALNDELRQQRIGGRIVATAGVARLGDAFVERLLNAVSAFDDFSEDNDPHHEHDFGTIELDNKKLFWKIDYYDPSLEFGSEDPADPDKTSRVLTVMFADEY